MNQNEKIESIEKNDEGAAVEDNKYVMVLKKPKKLDGVIRESIDLTALEELEVKDLIQARRLMNMAGATLDPYPERTPEFACYIASIKTGLPYEFFESLSAPDGMELKRRVSDFLY